MSSLYHNKYRISSARLRTWDYGNAGMYFVTICTANREFYFGDIPVSGFAPGDGGGIDVDGGVETRCIASLHHRQYRNQMQLSPIGKIAETEWIKTIVLRPDMNLELGDFVVMPNHFHGVIIIHKNRYNSGDGDFGDNGRDAMHRVSTVVTKIEPANHFAPQSKNLGSIIRGYKSAVTTYARKNNTPFNWQPRFHDHIIRSTDEYYRISNYIVNNPDQWQKDKFFRK